MWLDKAIRKTCANGKYLLVTPAPDWVEKYFYFISFVCMHIAWSVKIKKECDPFSIQSALFHWKAGSLCIIMTPTCNLWDYKTYFCSVLIHVPRYKTVTNYNSKYRKDSIVQSDTDVCCVSTSVYHLNVACMACFNTMLVCIQHVSH